MKNNKSIKIRIDQNNINENAIDNFEKISGLKYQDKISKGFKAEGFKVYKKIEGLIRRDVVYSYYDKFQLNQDTLTIDEIKLKCKAFQQINPHTIKGVYVYFINAGEYEFEDSTVMEQLLGDIWGTAITDALRKYFEEKLEEQTKISNCFGPGIFGMDIHHMLDIAKLTDFQSIDIEVSNLGILQPSKSCAGLYFQVTDEYAPIEDECRYCKGTKISCSFCSIKKGKANV